MAVLFQKDQYQESYHIIAFLYNKWIAFLYNICYITNGFFERSSIFKHSSTQTSHRVFENILKIILFHVSTLDINGAYACCLQRGLKTMEMPSPSYPPPHRNIK